MALGGQEERSEGPHTHEDVCSKRMEISALLSQPSQDRFHNKGLFNLVLSVTK